MIPIWFTNKNEREFKEGGRIIENVISCRVFWTSEGVFELEMKYPFFGTDYDLDFEQWICVKAYDGNNYEPFYIYKKDESMNGIVTVRAYHACYIAKKMPFYQMVGHDGIGFNNTQDESLPYIHYYSRGNRYSSEYLNKGFILDTDASTNEGINVDTKKVITFGELLYSDGKQEQHDITASYSTTVGAPPTKFSKTTEPSDWLDFNYYDYSKDSGFPTMRSAKEVDILYDKFSFKIRNKGKLGKELKETVSYGYNMTSFKRTTELSKEPTKYIGYSFADGFLLQDFPNATKNVALQNYDDIYWRVSCHYAPLGVRSFSQLNYDGNVVNDTYEFVDLSKLVDLPYKNSSLSKSAALTKLRNYVVNKINGYDRSVSPWAPKESIEVKFVPQQVENGNKSSKENIQPFDRLEVIHNKYKFYRSGRVTGFEYDVLGEKYNDITLTDFVPIDKIHIFEHPKSQKAKINEYVYFKVEASVPDGVTIRWLLSTNGGNSFSEIEGANSLSYRVQYTNTTKDYFYKCVITKGSYRYDSPTVTFINNNTIDIIEFPTIQEAYMGQSIELKCSALGRSITYEWQSAVSSNQNVWSTIGNESAITIVQDNFDRIYRCSIRDSLGHSKFTNEIIISTKYVTFDQPKDYYYSNINNPNRTFGFSINNAVGDLLTYEWVYKEDGTDEWIHRYGASSFELGFSYNELKRTYKCIITDKYGNRYESKEVRVYLVK